MSVGAARDVSTAIQPDDPPQADEVGDGGWARRPLPESGRGAWAAAAAAGLAALPLLVLLGDLVAGRPAITSYGDRAVTTLEVRDLLGGHQLVGAYSRFGWHHPGPAFFLPLAAADLVFGRAHWALDAGMLAAGAIAAALVVLTVARAAGLASALASAGLLGLYVHAVGPATLRAPWNPWGVLLPIALLTVLSALAASGSLPALACAGIVASVAVQTHVGAAPVSLGVLATAAILTWRARRAEGAGPRPSEIRRPAVWLPVLGVVALWLPPLVQQSTGSDPNLTDLWRFFLAGHRGHSLSTAVATVGERLGQFPLGSSHRLAAASGDVAWSRAGRGAMIIGAYLAAGALLAVMGRRRGDRFTSALGVLTIVAVAAAVLGVRSISGPLDGYVVAWVTVIPLGCWLGLAVLGQAATKRPAFAAVIGGVLALVATTVATTAAVGAPSARTEDSAAVRQAWADVSQRLAGRRPGSVLIEVARPEDWPVEAGLALEVEEHGWQAHVEDQWIFMFGNRRRQTGAEAFVATIRPGGVEVTNPLGSGALGDSPTHIAAVLAGAAAT